jgi:nucleoid-associated protein YgaU
MKKILICILGISLVLISCSKRPALTKAEEEPYGEAEALIKAAKSDIEAAKKSGAEKYAKDLILSAENSLKTAESSLEIKNFVKAKEAAQKASLDAKSAVSLPIDAKNVILEAEVEVNKAKDAKAEEEAPNEFKSANDLLNSAKEAVKVGDYKKALEEGRASIELARKSVEEPAGAKASIAQAEESLKMAKEMQVDQVSSDVYKVASEGLEAAKASLSSHDNVKAKELADKVANDIKGEMKRVVDLVIEQAKTDLNSAKEAGASEFAKELLEEAEGEMNNASSLLEKGDYINAKAAAEKVSSTSKEAIAKAQVGKEAKKISEEATAEAASTSTTSTEGVGEGAPASTETTEATSTSETATTSTETTSTTPSEATTQKVSSSVTKKPTSHTVVKGEYLWKISGYEIIYNDSLQWPIIYHANADQIKDPNLIYPKQVLKIPRDLTEEQIREARKEASKPSKAYKPSLASTKVENKNIESKSKEEEIPLTKEIAVSAQSKKPSFPIIPVIIILAGIIAIFVVRTIRKKVTATASI